MRAHPLAQQWQCCLDAVANGEHVGAHHALQQRRVESAGIDVFAGAGIEDYAVQRAPLRLDGGADVAHLFAVGEIAGQHQHTPWVAPGKGLQRLGAACRQRQAVPVGEQLTRQFQADATAGAGQPDTSREVHASLRCSQRMAAPSRGTCW